MDVGDKNGLNRHQRPKIVIKTFRHQHPSPTSMLSIRKTTDDSLKLTEIRIQTC